jgi:hypothetical protein
VTPLRWATLVAALLLAALAGVMLGTLRLAPLDVVRGALGPEIVCRATDDAILSADGEEDLRRGRVERDDAPRGAGERDRVAEVVALGGRRAGRFTARLAPAREEREGGRDHEPWEHRLPKHERAPPAMESARDGRERSCTARSRVSTPSSPEDL